jgi:CheY-like chemotaxis protein
LFEREPFDVILMDVQMPIMDGFQATARIRHIEHLRVQSSHRATRTAVGHQDNREIEPHGDGNGKDEEEEEEGEGSAAKDVTTPNGTTKRVPIVALTASATRDYEAECLEKGMDRFLTKPFKKETLQLTLRDIFQRPSADVSK